MSAELRSCIWFTVIISASWFILLFACKCFGDSRCPALPNATEQDALTLSRVVLGESGWSSPDDHAAIYQVLLMAQRRLAVAHGRPVSFQEAAEAYSPRATGKTQPRGRYVWVTTLDASGLAPDAWPRALPWERYRDRWLVLLNRSRRLLAGELRSECDREPLHWAAPSLHESATERGLVLVSCGETLNHFYRRGT